MEGYALIVGVDKVDHEHYGDDKDLCCSLVDSNKISSLLSDTNLFSRILVKNGISTTWDSLKEDFQILQNEANNNDGGSFVFLYFSGHGASFTMEGETKKKQFLCFYDKLILEDQIRRRIGGFNKNCSVFVVLDSCHSEGIPLTEVFSTRQFLIEKRSIRSLDGRPIPKTITSDFPQIYIRNKSLYQDTLDRYKNYRFSSEADIFYLLACGENEVTFTGDYCNKPSKFTNSFIEDLRFFLSNNTQIDYHSFANYLKENSHKTTKTTTHLTNSDNLFRKTIPLIYKSNIIDMASPIILDESLLGTNIKFDLDSTVPQYIMEYSMTWLIDSNDLNHTIWLNKLKTIDPALIVEIKYISFVFLEKQSPKNTPLPIRSLYKVDPTRIDAGYCTVVPVDDQMEILLGVKPKRTNGKVSNTLG